MRTETVAGSEELARAWRQAQEALPAGWALRGVVRGPREADPQIRSASWVAVARPERPRRDQPPVLEGRGATPEEALIELVVELRTL